MYHTGIDKWKRNLHFTTSIRFLTWSIWLQNWNSIPNPSWWCGLGLPPHPMFHLDFSAIFFLSFGKLSVLDLFSFVFFLFWVPLECVLRGCFFLFIWTSLLHLLAGTWQLSGAFTIAVMPSTGKAFLWRGTCMSGLFRPCEINGLVLKKKD